MRQFLPRESGSGTDGVRSASDSLFCVFLEHQNLVVLEVFQDLALHRGAFYYRCTYLDLTVVVCEQDLVETHRRIFFAGKTVDIEFPTFLALNC